MGDLIEPPSPNELTQAPVRRDEDDDLTGIRAGSSAKVDQLVALLQLTPSTEKSLVFSQFTGFLDKVGISLVKATTLADVQIRSGRRWIKHGKAI